MQQFYRRKAIEVLYETSSGDRNRDGHTPRCKTEDTWTRLIEGHSGINKISSFNTEDLNVKNRDKYLGG